MDYGATTDINVYNSRMYYIMKGVNYKKAGTYYFIGNIFNKGVAFLTVPIFTRILSTYDYGVINTYNSWVGIVSMIIGFALHMGIRLAFVDYEDKIDDFMATITLFTLAVSAICISAVIAIGNFFNINANVFLICLCLLHSFGVAIVTDYIHYLMMLYRYRFRTALMVLPNLISIIVSIGAILFAFKTEQYLGRIVPTSIINLFFGLLVVFLVLRKSHTFCLEYLKYCLAISAPLIVHGIALNILSQSDRIMITSLVNASQTGIYSLIYNFSMIATVITTSLEGIWLPWFTTKMKENKPDEINKLAIDYVNVMTYAMVCLIFVSPEVVKLLASQEYWEGIKIVPPIVLANYVIFAYSLYVNIEHYYKKTVFITINTIVAAVTNIVLNLLFIPKYGYIAASYTTLASYIVAIFMHARYAKKLEKSLYPIKTFFIPCVHLAITCVLFYAFIGKGIIRWVIVFAYFASMLFKERNKISEFFPDITKRIKKK